MESTSKHIAWLRRIQMLNGLGTIFATIFTIWLMSNNLYADPNWVFWLAWPMVMWHSIEEYFIPGKFIEWFNGTAFPSTHSYAPLTPKRAFFTDTVGGLIIMPLFILVGTHALWLILGLIFTLFFNACWHILQSLEKGIYSPGTVTSLLLIFPVVSYIVYFYFSNHYISLFELIIAVSIGISNKALFFAIIRRWQKSKSSILAP